MIRSRIWDREARAEWEAARREAWESSTAQSDRNDRYLEILRDGVQAHRRWAVEAMAEAERTGAAAQLKTWHKAQRTVALSYKGEVVTKPRTIGVKRQAEDGVRYDEQTLFDFMTWDELTEKRKAYLQQMKAYSQNVALMDRLLALHDMAPAAATPSEAAATIGTTLDQWLGVAA